MGCVVKQLAALCPCNKTVLVLNTDLYSGRSMHGRTCMFQFSQSHRFPTEQAQVKINFIFWSDRMLFFVFLHVWLHNKNIVQKLAADLGKIFCVCLNHSISITLLIAASSNRCHMSINIPSWIPPSETAYKKTSDFNQFQAQPWIYYFQFYLVV